MRTETRMFFDAMLRENRPITEFLDAKYTFLNERLAKHYGIDGVHGPGLPARRTDDTDQRGGVLSQAQRADCFELSDTDLAGHSRQIRAAEHSRQRRLRRRRRMFRRWMKPSVGNAGSMRQQLEKHRAMRFARPATAGWTCSASGWRTTTRSAVADEGRKIRHDSSGYAAERQVVRDAGGDATLLKSDCREFSRCLTEKMLTYALGRGLERYDRERSTSINRKLAVEITGSRR